MSDYADSGFDGFLSRSVDAIQQPNLDSAGPITTQMPFDRAHVSGFLGDTFTIGDISLEKDSINQKINGNIQMLIGTQTDGSSGITIAKEGFDADIKRPQNLIFNSQQNVFKIKLSDTYTFPGIDSIPAGLQVNQFFTINHGLGYVPAYLTYAFVYNTGVGVLTTFPTQYYVQFGSQISLGDPSSHTTSSVVVGIDSNNLYLARGAFNGDPSIAYPASPVSVRYYILQETAV